MSSIKIVYVSQKSKINEALRNFSINKNLTYKYSHPDLQKDAH